MGRRAVRMPSRRWTLLQALRDKAHIASRRQRKKAEEMYSSVVQKHTVPVTKTLGFNCFKHQKIKGIYVAGVYSVAEAEAQQTCRHEFMTLTVSGAK